MTATLGDRSNSLLTFDTQRLVVWCVPTRGVVTKYGEGGGGGLQNGRARAREVLHLQKGRGGGIKRLSHAEGGGGHKKCPPFNGGGGGGSKFLPCFEGPQRFLTRDFPILYPPPPPRY